MSDIAITTNQTVINSNSNISQPGAAEFKKEISLFGGISILGGIMIGSGIFYLGSYVLMRTGMSMALRFSAG